jgi:superfamily II DNA/RNA helicase
VSPRVTTAKTVKQWVITTDKKHKPELFLHLMKKQRWGQVLVFVKTRRGVDQLVTTLQEHGVAADSIHGDKPQPARLRALERFKASQVQVLVATDVAARGLDIDALPLVVNFDLPNVPEDYVHRIGRTGRAGAEGLAISLVCADEVDLLSAIEKLIREVLRREEEPGFEADHRVPDTGTPKPAAKVVAPGKKKRPFTGPPGGKAALAAQASAKPGSLNAAAGRRPAKAAVPAIPKGAVIVTGGRGAKSAARAAGQAAAAAPSKKTGRGSVKR